MCWIPASLAQALPGHKAALQAGPLCQEARRLQGAPDLHGTRLVWPERYGKILCNWEYGKIPLKSLNIQLDVCCLCDFFEICDDFLEMINVVMAAQLCSWHSECAHLRESSPVKHPGTCHPRGSRRSSSAPFEVARLYEPKPQDWDICPYYIDSWRYRYDTSMISCKELPPAHVAVQNSVQSAVHRNLMPSQWSHVHEALSWWLLWSSPAQAQLMPNVLVMLNLVVDLIKMCRLPKDGEFEVQWKLQDLSKKPCVFSCLNLSGGPLHSLSHRLQHLHQERNNQLPIEISYDYTA